jgi:hypothetical protein
LDSAKKLILVLKFSPFDGEYAVTAKLFHYSFIFNQILNCYSSLASFFNNDSQSLFLWLLLTTHDTIPLSNSADFYLKKIVKEYFIDFWFSN